MLGAHRKHAARVGCSRCSSLLSLHITSSSSRPPCPLISHPPLVLFSLYGPSLLLAPSPKSLLTCYLYPDWGRARMITTVGG